MPIKIDYKKCCLKDGKCMSCSCSGECDGCVEVCPVNALKRGKVLEYDASVCIDCGLCADVCKYKAITLIE